MTGPLGPRSAGGMGDTRLAGLRRSLGRWLRDADAAGLDERTMAALFEMSLHDFHAATAGAVA